ncbi:hypothetical protein AN652_18445 [Xanthomonas arboricola pv. pruni]|uniref:Uncharacterized protein n=2 Tax=Xanthomonas arboricola pv. pruni TaxID=69929 RepID=W4SKJ6_9XANT|nr:hypothetical protein DK27_05750 [Xanthomonas arboricola pv. pruni]GAE52874.1 hypothetical protein XPU_4406 [Xanthomonas arboricola pv. pruni str. MAFF 311562]GAE57090.1 hypothetical protein XPR_3725 [Xanthomonas arboricola pv. pruni MAFF 301420]GAE61769.1 hypothetical protein XPN_3675 [Xanthomonas arboricola pv. pruni MAFF 301427]KPN07482.1 hypothetical protein AN652_18445 [Xanthomonas arboricola pv. pruni]
MFCGDGADSLSEIRLSRMVQRLVGVRSRDAGARKHVGAMRPGPRPDGDALERDQARAKDMVWNALQVLSHRR